MLSVPNGAALARAERESFASEGTAAARASGCSGGGFNALLGSLVMVTTQSDASRLKSFHGHCSKILYTRPAAVEVVKLRRDFILSSMPCTSGPDNLNQLLCASLLKRNRVFLSATLYRLYHRVPFNGIP